MSPELIEADLYLLTPITNLEFDMKSIFWPIFKLVSIRKKPTIKYFMDILLVVACLLFH